MNSDILTTKVFLLFLTLSARKFLHIPQINLSHVHIKKYFNDSEFPRLSEIINMIIVFSSKDIVKSLYA